MADRKIIAVVGATGAQGGGLARAILADPDGGFAVRALTRKPASEKAAELARLGAELVQADADDPQSLRRAFQGAWGAFCVTNYWEHFQPEKEVAQARAMAKAAREAGLHHVIWSTLEDTRKWVPIDDDRLPTLMERYKVPHFDGKGEADAIFAEEQVPTTFLLTSFYWDNFIHFGMGPARGADGRLAITMPMGNASLPGIAAEDIGRCAYGIFKGGDEYIGEYVGIAGDHVTGQEMAATLSSALGEEVHYNAVEPDVYRSFGFPGADDLGSMFQFKRDFESDFRAVRSVERSKRLNPALHDFKRWVGENRERIPVPGRQ